jgi:hypothetical protein
MERRMLLIVGLLMAFASSVYAAPPLDANFAIDPLSIVERFKFSRSDGAILVPVQIGEKTYRFMLDTGATISVVDKSLVAETRPLTKGKNDATGGSVDIFAMPESRLGKSDLKENVKLAAAFDLTKLSEVAGYEIHGVLGCDFFLTCVVQVDFDNEEVLILTKPPKECGDSFHVSFSKPNRPAVKVKIAGRSEELILDTGANSFDSGCLKPKVSAALLEGSKLRVIGQALHETVSGTSASRLLQADQMSLGAFITPQPVFGENADNLLGLNYLSRFCVTFDLGGRRVFLKEGKRFRQTDDVDRSGLHILRRDAQAMIHSVDPGSAGANAGLLAGDRILFVGDIRGDVGPLHAMRGMLCAAGATVPIVIRRADRETTVQLHLAPAPTVPPK